MDFDKDIQSSISPQQPRPRRSILKCAGIFCGIITLVVISVISWFVINAIWTFVDATKDPHKSLVYDGDISDSTRTSFVSPLFDSSTQFDVALLVSARKPNDETTHAEEYATGNKWDESDYTAAEISVAGFTGMFPAEVRHLPQEETLYSGIVLRNVSLSDRDLDTQVAFKLPLKRFYDRYLYGPDVRVSIALIPTVNSKLDRLEDFTDWKPEDMARLEKVEPSLMATIPLNTVGEDDTARWDAIEHIALSFPLIEFHESTHPCETGAGSKDEGLVDDEDLYSSVRLEEEIGDNALPKEGNTKRKDINEKLHPFLVTRRVGPILVHHFDIDHSSRSHFYIVNETRWFDRKLFDQKHKTLRQYACGKNLPGQSVTRFLCGGDYMTNGHWQNRLVLHGKDGGKRELAYGPAIGSLKHAAGPRDVRPLPVTRYNCSSSSEVADPAYMNVTYNIRFSSLSVGRVHMLDSLVSGTRAAHNATEQELIVGHSQWEVTNGLFGDKAHGVHPWRRFLLTFVNDICVGLTVGVLTITYWYTRLTTTGITRLGTLVGALSLILRATHGFILLWQESDTWFGPFMEFMLSILEIYPVYLQLQLISPFEIKRVGWGWTARHRVTSHRERASERKGAQIAWTTWAGAFIALCLLTYIPGRYDTWLVRPGVPPTAEDTEVGHLIPAIAHAGELLAIMMQLHQNEVSETFAGQYALTAALMVARRVMGLLYYSPTFIGRVETKEGIQFAALLEMGLEGWTLYQAWTLPKVEQAKIDEDNE